MLSKKGRKKFITVVVAHAACFLKNLYNDFAQHILLILAESVD